LAATFFFWSATQAEYCAVSITSTTMGMNP
jgi:hypothetical protein